MQLKVKSHAQGQEAVASWAGGGRPLPSEDKNVPYAEDYSKNICSKFMGLTFKIYTPNTNYTSNFMAHAVPVQSHYFYGIIYPEQIIQ